MRKLLVFLLAITFLVAACGPTPEEIATKTASSRTKTPTPSNTPAPTATETEIPLNTLEGVVFFDYNGSGEQDAAYGMDGLPVEEPGIADVPVCVDHNPYLSVITDDALCTVTDKDGSYFIEGITSGFHQLYVKSPTGDPETAFRYINISHGWVDIPAYEMNGVQVPDQHVPDTEIVPISSVTLLTFEGDMEQNFALMQGFLTLPFVQEQVGEMPLIFNYFDVIGTRLFNSENNFFSTQDGIMLNYNGSYNSVFSPNPYVPGTIPSPGVSDSHNGLDFFVPIGTYVVSGIPNSKVWMLTLQDGEQLIHLKTDSSMNISNSYAQAYGHLSAQLVETNQKIYRGQIIGLSGNSGYYSGNFPQLHFDLFISSQKGSFFLDPFRCVIDLNPLPENFWGSSISYWTVDNNPQFSR